MSGSRQVGLIKLGANKRSSQSEVDRSGSKNRNLATPADGILRRTPTLDSKKSISQEDYHPSGAGRGERRREMRGVIAPQPPLRRSSSKERRASSKDPVDKA